MDERLAQIEKEKQNALNSSNSLYDNMLSDNQALLNQQNEYAKQYETTQNSILDKQLDNTITNINKQKEETLANKDEEVRKAKNDYIAYINPYGYQSEALAQNGLLNSGVSETSKLGGYNTYQNRLASANKIAQSAITEYDKNINEARLNNDVTKAQNALEKLKMQLVFSETFYNNKQSISESKFNNALNIDNNYYSRYQDTYNQINQEKAQEEAIRQFEVQQAENRRQFDEEMAYQKQQAAQSQANWEKEYALSKSSNSSSSSSSSSKSSYDLSDDVTQPDDYYMSNGYQPNYIYENGKYNKLTDTGKRGRDVFSDLGKDGYGNNRVWSANGKYYIFSLEDRDYVDITDSYIGKIVSKKKADYFWNS